MAQFSRLVLRVIACWRFTREHRSGRAVHLLPFQFQACSNARHGHLIFKNPQFQNFKTLKNMAALICGSIAIDTLMTFDGRFSDRILPDQIHILNLSFIVPTLRRDYGGCAGNIAYALKQLGGDPLPMGTIGSDGSDYVNRLNSMGISTEFVCEVKGSYTAQAMIMADQDTNQIAAFHPGAMMQSHITKISPRSDIRLGIIAPDSRDGMLEHAEQFKAAGIPFVFDPGQNLALFDAKELLHFVQLATWVTVNDYEAKLLCDRTGLSCAELSQHVDGLIVTLGAEGSEVWINGSRTAVAPVKAVEVLDPTGCGDAFRAALLFGLEKGWPLVRCAELGNRVGAHKIAFRGAQNYTLEAEEI
jgi:adenosine kinase